MDSLVDKCAKEIVKQPIMLNEICKDIVKQHTYVYIPLRKVEVDYNGVIIDGRYNYVFMNVVYSSKEKAQTYINELISCNLTAEEITKTIGKNVGNIHIDKYDCIFIKVPLDINYPCDKVYILMNYSYYPQIVTNNYEEYKYNKELLRGYYFDPTYVDHEDSKISIPFLMVDDEQYLNN